MLVVDDEPAVLKAVVLLLRHVGHVVETAECGADALCKLQEKEFDVLLTDLYMPGMKGDELAREVKRRYPKLPIVLITATPPGGPLPGITCVLAKPFAMQELWKTVNQVTSDQRSGEGMHG